MVTLGKTQGLPRQRRLRRPEEFRRVFAEGCRSTLGPLVLLSCPNALDVPRLGIAVPKRHVRSAVDRNAIKRHVREGFRRQSLVPRDFVVMVRAGFDWPSSRLDAALDELWQLHSKRCAASP